MIICVFIVYLNHCPHVLIKIYEFLKRLVEYFKKHGEYLKVSKIFLFRRLLFYRRKKARPFYFEEKIY